MTIIEKILAQHSDNKKPLPGDIIDVWIDARVARDFGGANVVKNLMDNGLKVHDAAKTFFTFDCNPGGSDQKYAENQHFCRQYARENDIRVFDVNEGVGTHIAIDKGLILPGGTFVSTDSHANIMGAIGAFGQGMGDQDIAAAWANGYVWFKVPESVKINFLGQKPENITAKDITLNLLKIFGANKLLGYSVEICGEAADKLSLDERITISSMATEMGAIILFFTPSAAIAEQLRWMSGKDINIISADSDAHYVQTFDIDISSFVPMLALPGHPHDNDSVEKMAGKKIDSAFIGSCTNGRMEDLRAAAAELKGRKVAPGVVLKIVPATDAIWQQALDEGLIHIFKDAGALVSNAGCAGCAAGQVGQNGPGEVSISTGNRNFSGKQGKGEVFLASPDVVAASAVAGVITLPGHTPASVTAFEKTGKFNVTTAKSIKEMSEKPVQVTGRVWIIKKDDIDTDMIFHNRYLTITNISEMGQYTFDNLSGYTDFAKKAMKNDIVITSKNFGAGSSRQQAVDCFLSLGVACILAESFGAIYERNAINAALAVMTYKEGLLEELDLQNGDTINLNFVSGEIENLRNTRKAFINPFYDAQLKIYQKGGLLG